jgi:hypothetical protein
LLDLVYKYFGDGIVLKVELRASFLPGIWITLSALGLQVFYWELKKLIWKPILCGFGVIQSAKRFTSSFPYCGWRGALSDRNYMSGKSAT